MSQLTDIYNSLMNDPDIIPPKKMSKDKYVLNMAQQRIKQHENNAEALEMGFAKNYGHFSGGYSAVNKLAAFVNPPAASPPTFFELLQLMKAKQWWKDEDRSGGLHPEGPMNIHPSAVKDLQEKGYNREMRYASNQNSCFVDEQDSNAILEHIIFENGGLFVPKTNQPLQKLLSLYHPKKGYVYDERDTVAEAKEDLVSIETEMEALNTAVALEIDQAEAILRTEIGSEVSKMASKEIKRDLLRFARDNSRLFIELSSDDNVQLRNFGIKAVEQGLIELANDQRSFTIGKNKRKLFSVPFDENPYAALAAWFKTDEGVEVYKNVAKKLI